MFNNKNILNFIYILIFVFVASIGLNQSLGITSGEFSPPIFYTSVSGLICFTYFLVAAIRGIYYLVKTKMLPDALFIFPRMKGAVTMCITVTLLVYHFVVYEGPIYTINFEIGNFIPHYLVPVMVMIHWLVFDQKGVYKKIDPLLWTVIPLLYFVWANIVALQHQDIPFWDGKFYPYGFMDLTVHSLSQVTLSIIVLLLFFIALGYGIYALDQKLSKAQQSEELENLLTK